MIGSVILTGFVSRLRFGFGSTPVINRKLSGLYNFSLWHPITPQISESSSGVGIDLPLAICDMSPFAIPVILDNQFCDFCIFRSSNAMLFFSMSAPPFF